MRRLVWPNTLQKQKGKQSGADLPGPDQNKVLLLEEVEAVRSRLAWLDTLQPIAASVFRAGERRNAGLSRTWRDNWQKQVTKYFSSAFQQ